MPEHSKLFASPCCILAPMVRVGHLGFRELCTQCDADIVFTEEVVAAKLALCTREVVSYPRLETTAASSPVVEYVCYEAWKNKWKRTVVLSVLPFSSPLDGRKRGHTILQLGVSEPTLAARVARLVAADVDGIDLNMGCPKRFSVANGFGSALMKKTELAGNILRAIHEAQLDSLADCQGNNGASPPHLSFKCRLLPTPNETYQMLRQVLIAAVHSASHPVVNAITIHARYIEQRSETLPCYAEAHEVVLMCRQDSLFDGVQFALNGSLESRHDALEKCKTYGFDAGMLARSALRDPSVFTKGDGERDTESRREELRRLTENPRSRTEEMGSLRGHYKDVLKKMLYFAALFRTPFNNFKYHVLRMAPEIVVIKDLVPKVQSETREYKDFLPILGVENKEDALYELCRSVPVEVQLLEQRPTHHTTCAELQPGAAKDVTLPEKPKRELSCADQERSNKRLKQE